MGMATHSSVVAWRIPWTEESGAGGLQSMGSQRAGHDCSNLACMHGYCDASLIPGSGSSPGEGIGNPLQYSCLENPVDRGAWWTAVHSVAKSWIRLKPMSMHTCQQEFLSSQVSLTSLSFPLSHLGMRTLLCFLFQWLK